MVGDERWIKEEKRESMREKGKESERGKSVNEGGETEGERERKNA